MKFIFLKICNVQSCFTTKLFQQSGKEKRIDWVTKMCLLNCNCVILNQGSSSKQQHMKAHTVCARYAELGKSGEQMSSVPDQLQREVGRSRYTAVRADDRNAQGGDGGQ